MEIRISINDAKALQAMDKMPGVVERHADPRLGVVAARVARDAKLNLAANKSMLFSTLANSIISRRLALLHWQASTGTNYARAVEEGTGPAAGQKSYMPNPEVLYPYVKMRGRVSMGKADSPKRLSALREIRDRAWALALHIKTHGTKPHPYMAPAVEKNRSGAAEQVALGVAAGLAEVFG